MTFGAWNTRQMGAYSVHTDTWAKTRRLFNLIEKRNWEVAMLSDVAFGDSGIRKYRTPKQTWTMIGI